MPLCDELVSHCQNFDFKIRRVQQKSYYERRDYKSVDEKSLYLRLCAEKRQKKNSDSKGLMEVIFSYIK